MKASDLGQGQEASSSTRTTRRSSRAPARPRTSQGSRQADPDPDRGDHLRLRPREAPGAAGQAGRRRRRDQGRRGDRVRDEGEEGPRRGRDARDQGGRRRGHRPRRWRGPAPLRRRRWTSLAKKAETNEDQAIGVRIVRRALEEPLRQIANNAGHEGSVVVNKVKRARGRQGLQRPGREVRQTWSRPASSTRPRSCAPA